jgi:hypothetical protein
MFYESVDTFSLATGEADNANFLSDMLSVHRICEFHILALEGLRWQAFKYKKTIG